MGWNWHGWHMGWMAIFWIVLIIAIVWLLTRAGVTSAPSASSRRESAEEVLKRRYASGEIGPDDYKRMLNEIRR